MEINSIPNLDPVRYRPVSQKPGNPTGVPPPARFDSSTQLDQALQMTPEVRPEMVENGRKLLGDVAYPPQETIRRIAVLLALNLEDGK